MKHVFIVSVLLSGWTSAGADEVTFHRNRVVRFATPKQGVTAISKRDRFIKAMSPFDRQSRLRTAKVVTVDEYLDFVKTHVIAWDQSEKDKALAAVESIDKKLAEFKIPFPKRILLVKTTGEEEGGAAYCRGNAIVLPRSKLADPAEKLERLLIHELFHILSSHNETLRRELYAIIGFEPCGHEVPLPASLRNRKITNPDGPTVEHRVELTVDGKAVHATPVLYSSVETYDVKKGGTLFDSMQFKLMVIESADGKWQAVAVDGAPVMLDPGKTQSYFDRIGKNTSYIIHPDEILAENFVHLVNGTKELSTPRIVEQLRQALRRRTP